MSKSRLQDFELPDDAIGRVSKGSDADSRFGARPTTPQDLYPLESRGAPPRRAQSSQGFANTGLAGLADTRPAGLNDTRPAGLDDTRPAGLVDTGNDELPSGFHVRIAAPRVHVAESTPIMAPVIRRGRPAGDGPQPKRVLVVDDDITTRLYLRSRLMLRGHVQLLEAASGAQAMEFMIMQRFDAVLLDVDMGEQNGFEVCRAIRSHVRSIRGKQPRIYIITSRNGVLDRMRAKMAGADAFLSKPPHPGELAELLAQL